MTRLFIHFAPGEALPQAGDVISIHSEMTGLDYETTIQRIIAMTRLDDGRIRLTIDGNRREVPPSNVIVFPEREVQA